MEKEKKKTEMNKVAIVAVLVLAALFVGFYAAKGITKPYAAVLMEGGDLYFGQVSHFPHFTLSNVHTLQFLPDPQNPDALNPRLVPFDLNVWSPEKLRINKDKVVFISPLDPDSEIATLLRSESPQ